MALTGNITAAVNLSNTLDNVDLSTPREAVGQTVTKEISTGQVYHDTRTIALASSLTLDFTDSSLSDVFGNAIAFTSVKAVYIKAHTTNGDTITITTDTNTFLPTLPSLDAGQGMVLQADIDVTTNGKIKIVNDDAAAAVNVDIIVVGA